MVALMRDRQDRLLGVHATEKKDGVAETWIDRQIQQALFCVVAGDQQMIGVLRRPLRGSRKLSQLSEGSEREV